MIMTTGPISHHGPTITRGIRTASLGQVMVEGELVPCEQVARALELKRQINRKLGQILVELGTLDPEDLEAVLKLQDELNDVHAASHLVVGIRFRLGQLLLELKRITPQQLGSALEERRKTGEKLGAVLLRLGWVDPEELDAALELQRRADKKIPEARLRLGEILVATGHISRKEMDEALTRQKQVGMSLAKESVADGNVGDKSRDRTSASARGSQFERGDFGDCQQPQKPDNPPCAQGFCLS
jgi:chitinase